MQAPTVQNTSDQLLKDRKKLLHLDLAKVINPSTTEKKQDRFFEEESGEVFRGGSFADTRPEPNKQSIAYSELADLMSKA